MTKKELKNEYKKEKKQIKKNYKLTQKMTKLKYIDDLKNVTYTSSSSKLPYRSVINEVGNSVSHGIGSLFGVLSLFFMLRASSDIYMYIGAFVYSIGMFLLFTMSSLYHAFAYGSKVKILFRRFDYSSIYLLIGATYTPILLNAVGGVFGVIFCISQWTLIIVGVTFIGVFGPTKLKWLHNPLYIILGWCGVVLIPYMWGSYLLWYILGGGIIYTLGIIPFALNKKSAHFIWHIFVLGGAIVQWLGVYLCIYL